MCVEYSGCREGSGIDRGVAGCAWNFVRGSTFVPRMLSLAFLCKDL